MYMSFSSLSFSPPPPNDDGFVNDKTAKRKVSRTFFFFSFAFLKCSFLKLKLTTSFFFLSLTPLTEVFKSDIIAMLPLKTIEMKLFGVG